MKNKFKKAFISGAIMATGLGVGFAASTAIQDLDAIKNDFDYILNLNTSKQAEIDGLNTTIADLRADIAELEQNQNSSGKQQEIKDLKAQVEALEAERDNVIKDNTNLEAKITELLNYTNERTSELRGKVAGE